MTLHKWSGWPGAFCLKCGSDDPIENAIGLGWLDPYTGEYNSEEHRLEVMKALECRVEDEYADGEPCSHPGCCNHITHPCEGCGRIGCRKDT